MRVDAATYGVGGVKERGMEVEREGGGQYQALPKVEFQREREQNSFFTNKV